MNLVKKSDLARMGKVNASLISKNIRKGYKWYYALDNDSGCIDADFPDIVDWLIERENVKSPEDMVLKDYENLTLKNIIEEYSSIPQFHELSKIYKIIADTERTKIQIEASRNELVSREGVAKACFGYLYQLNKRLLDMPQGRVPKIMAIIEEETLDGKEKINELLVDEISKIIKGTKKDLINRLGDDFAEETG